MERTFHNALQYAFEHQKHQTIDVLIAAFIFGKSHKVLYLASKADDPTLQFVL